MDPGEPGGGLTALRQRVDERSEQLAHLVERVESLEEKVPEAQARARGLKYELEGAREKREGLWGMVIENAGGLLEASTWLLFAIPIVVVVVAIGTCLTGSEDPPFAAEALGTAVQGEAAEGTPAAAALGHTCEVALSPGSRRGRCRLVVDCAPVVFDAEAQCTLDHRSIGSGDDEESYEALVLSSIESKRPRLRFDEDVGLLVVSPPSEGSLQITVHQIAWEGEP